ncbi:MAG TPA: glycosyltransferase family 39 protein [Acidobacteriota bacterium]|nr:glycosyltransferase family 39 protein [Acidobacteriota bacterium]
MMRFLAYAAIALYLICSLLFLEKPGLYYDETFFVNVALGNKDGSFIELEAPIGKYRIPLMLMPYIGALKSYFYFPIFKFFGTSPATVRLPPIFLGLLTFFLTYLVVRNTLGSKIGVASIILFATDPSFIFMNKLDLGPIAFMMLFKMLSLLLLFRWLKEGSAWMLFLACLIMGLGIFDKVVFLWYVAAVAISLLLVFWPTVKTVLNAKRLVISTFCIFLFLIPPLIANVRSSWNLFKQRNVLNTSLIETFRFRRILFDNTLDGRALYQWVNLEDLASKSPPPNANNKNLLKVDSVLRSLPVVHTLMSYATIFSIVLLPLFTLFGWIDDRRFVIFYLCVFVLTATFIYITDMATGPHHVLMLYPFQYVLIATLLFGTQNKFSSRMLIRVFVLILLVLANLIIDARYVSSFGLMGGSGTWSDAIYDLAKYGQKQNNKTFLLMDWGLSNQLLVLQGSGINKQNAAIDFINIPSEDEKLSAMEPLFGAKNAFFVFFVPNFEAQPSLSYFKKALQTTGREYRLTKSFNERSGNPVYLVYELYDSDLNVHNPSCVQIEAESFSNKSGGSVISLSSASNNNALADYWGLKSTDYASYQFFSQQAFENAQIHIRYAYLESVPQSFYIYLDERLVDVVVFESTGGYGHSEQEWKVANATLGQIYRGNHQLIIKPSKDSLVVNLDFLAIDESDACSSAIAKSFQQARGISQ